MRGHQILSASLAIGLTISPALAENPVIYTTHRVQNIEVLEAAVEDSLDIGVDIITGGTGVLLRRIEAESSAPQGDVFWSSSINSLGAFKTFFQPYTSPEMSAVQESLLLPDDLFQPTDVTVVTMLVNTDLLDGAEMPDSWADLADPVWRGKIIVPDPANSSTGYTIAWGLSQLLEKEIYEAVVANLVISGSSSAVPKGVAMGEYSIGLTFEVNGYPYVDGGRTDLELVYPEEGTFVTAEYAGLLKGASGEETAKKVLDVLLSKPFQIELLKVGFFRPSRTDIKVSDYIDLPDLGDINVADIDEEEAAAARESFLAAWANLPKADDTN